MDKKQAHKIAQAAAVAAYKLTMKKLAQDVDLMGAMKDSLDETRPPSPVRPAKAPLDAPHGSTEVVIPEGGRERHVPEVHQSPGKTNSPLKPIENRDGTVTPAPRLVDFPKGASKSHKEILRVASSFQKTIAKYSR